MGIIDRVVATIFWQKALGQEVKDGPLCRIVRNAGQPLIWDANHVSLIRARTDEEIDQVFELTRPAFSHAKHYVIHTDPLTPALVEARLAMEGYSDPSATLCMVLSGTLKATPLRIDIRPVVGDDDWQSLGEMFQENLAETGPTEARDIVKEIAAGLLAVARTRGSEFQFFIARAEGMDCGYGAGGSCPDGIGIVEDIFTRRTFRKRGIGTAVISHAIDFARANGADDILIATGFADTPKRLYAALGFRPVCVTRQYLKSIR